MIRGVLGGSFDPVHNGHLAMARYVLDRGLAHCLHVIPARISPHKSGTGALPARRLDMVRLAFDAVPGVVVDQRELHRPGPSFTVDTLEELAREHPADSLLLVIGQDNLAGLGTWRDIDRIARLAQVAVLAREGDTAVPGPGLPVDLNLRYCEDFHQPVSSTTIRAILRESGPGRMLAAAHLPPKVTEYIARHQLYSS